MSATAIEAEPAVAATVFGVGLERAQRYADLLAGAGVVRGLVGPREGARIWTRHLLNCAVLQELLPGDARVVDVGTGAGLPGLALACAMPPVRIDLVDTLTRRTDFLVEAVAALGLGDRVRVVTGRAESAPVVSQVGGAHWVVARAVAPLDRLASWCLPLLRPGGTLLAMKGEKAETEIATHIRAIRRAGGSMAEVVQCGVGTLPDPVRVVQIVKR